MNDYKRHLLEKHSKQIYDDVQTPEAEGILLHLQSKNILQAHEVKTIKSSSNPIANLVKLLLNQKDGTWFEEFLVAMSREFSWIADSIKNEFYHEKDVKMTYYLSGRGCVPPLPQHNVTRTNYVKKMRQQIKNLKRDEYLVVHGMSGCGKTCLVVDSLHDMSLLETSLQGCVYWLSVGDLKDDPDDLQCQQLQKKLCDMVNLTTHSQTDVLRQLKLHFSTKPDYDALLVLDDVSSTKVIQALSVGCKILVTTQDFNVIKPLTSKKLFPVNEGFSESESIQLLQGFVIDGPGELKPAIKDCALNIHRLWKGHPIVIGLIGGELSETKEESQTNQSRWKEYEQSRSHDNNDNSVSRRQSIVEEQINSIIEYFMDKLGSDLKALYEKLAVLVEDTNITSDVLQILWDMDRSEVRKVMNQFYRRSLVYQKFNNSLNDSIFGIHDLLIKHLKEKLNPQELKSMNKELIDKYRDACQGDFAKLPSDNYIYSYLCHHIDQACEWNTYREQFFSLLYIESKLKATGPGDLLLDLHKYQKGLVGNSDEYYAKIEAIKKFVEKHGWDINQDEIDVIQCALLEPAESFLYIEGARIANERTGSRIYFSPINTPRERPKELKKRANVKSVNIITTNSSNHFDGRILIYPDEENRIVELDLNYRQTRRTFNVDSDVVKIKVSPLSDKFLSASKNGCINIWNLTLNGPSNANTPPPSLRQKNYLAYFVDERTTPSITFTHKNRNRPVTCASFSNDGKLMVSSSEDGTVCVWNLESNEKIVDVNVHPNPYAKSCAFLSGDEMIVYCCQNLHVFFFDVKAKEKKFSWKADEGFGNVLDVVCLPDEIRKVIVVQERAVSLYHWEDQSLRHIKEGQRVTVLSGFHTKILHQNGERVTCASYCPKHRLLVGTSHGCVLYFNVLDETRQSRNFGSGEIKAVDMVGSRVVYAQHDTVRMSWPDPESEVTNVSRPLCANLGWTNRGVSVYATCNNSEIQVFHDGKQVASRYYPEKIWNVCHVSPHGNQVLLGTTQGNLLLFDVVSGNLSALKSEFQSDIIYLSMEILQLDPLYIAAAKQFGQEEAHTLQIVKYDNLFKTWSGISSPVVKTFLCRHHFIIVVLKNYSVMVWDLYSQMHFPIQEGRVSADVTDASLSKKEDVLVLSDKENCFHILTLSWPDNIKNNLNENQNILINETRKLNIGDGIDEVDGTCFSIDHKIPDLKFKTYYLPSSSWCCCACSQGEFAAVGYGPCDVIVRNVKERRQILNYSVLPNRNMKVSQVKFSPYDVSLGNKIFKLILLVVTDCVSLWDLSPFVSENGSNANLAIKSPTCLGCVKTNGLPIFELSVNFPLSKFAAYDPNGTYFLWKVWDLDN